MKKYLYVLFFLILISQTISAQIITGFIGGNGDGYDASTHASIEPQALAYHNGYLYISEKPGLGSVRKINLATNIIYSAFGVEQFGALVDSEAYYYSYSSIYSLFFDPKGNLYYADPDIGTNEIYLNDTGGKFHDVVSSTRFGYSGDGSDAVDALISGPMGVTKDRIGNIYFSDNGNKRIRVIDTNGIIYTYAGGGASSPVGVMATAAILNGPTSIAVDKFGNVYFVDNVSLYKINTAGIINPVTGIDTPNTIYMDSSGTDLYVSAQSYNYKYNVSGSVSTINLGGSYAIAVDDSANVYFASYTSSNAPCIIKQTPGGIQTTICKYRTATPGNGDGYDAFFAHFDATARNISFSPGTSAYGGLGSDLAGNIYIADENDQLIRKVNKATGIISTVAGNGLIGFTGDGGAATNAQLDLPCGVATDHAGNIYIADYGSHHIRKVDITSGNISTLAGIDTARGDGGPATAAAVYPTEVALDSSGNIYLTDWFYKCVRKIDVSTGIINTIFTVSPSSSADNNPTGIAVDLSNNVYAVDNDRGEVYKIFPTGSYSVFAGGGSLGDSVLASESYLVDPLSVTADRKGNVYISLSNTGHSPIRSEIKQVDKYGYIHTVAGFDNIDGYIGDSTLATKATLYGPTKINIDTFGNLYIIEGCQNCGPGIYQKDSTIRKVCCLPGNIDKPPYFLNGDTVSISACENGRAMSIDSFLSVSDGDVGQTLTWSISTASTYDTLGGFIYTTASTGGIVVPTGLTYKPVAGYASAYDYVTIRVCDGYDISFIVLKVNILDSPVVAGHISGSRALCTGDSATYTITGSGTGTWSVTNSNAIITSTGKLYAINNGLDTIKYVVENICGYAVSTYTVAINAPLPILPPIAVPTVVCTGESVTLTDSITGGTWHKYGGAPGIIGASTGVLTPTSSGYDYIEYYITNACGTKYDTAIVVVHASPNPGYITGVSFACLGSTTTLIDTSSGGIWSMSNGDASIADGIITPIAEGIDTAYYSDSNICGIAAASLVITISAVPPLTPITGASVTCVGTSLDLGNSITGGYWSTLNPYLATVGISDGIFTGLADGTATVYYSVTSSCGAVVDSATVLIQSAPAIGAITGSTEICVGAATTLSDTSAGGIWLSSDPGVAGIDSSGIVTGISTGESLISYTISNACGNFSTLTIVNVSSSGTISPVTGATEVCEGSSISLADATPGGSWSSAAAGIASVSSTGIVTGILPGVTTITYTAPGICGLAYATLNITVELSPDPGSISGGTTVCIGSGDVLSSSATGGTWSVTNGNANISTAGLLTGLAAGTDTVIYAVTNSCGSASATYTVAIGTAPYAGIITGGDSVCAGSNVTFTDVAGSGTWSLTNPNATITGAGVVTGVLMGVDTVLYTVSTSCASAIAAAVFTITGATAGTITGSTAVCEGALITLTDPVSGGTWSSGSPGVATVSATGVVTGISGGLVDITYAVSGACGSAVSSIIITVNASPSVGPITGTSIICAGSVATLSEGTPGGTWSTSAAAIASVSAAGIVDAITPGIADIHYVVTGTCGTAEASFIVTVDTIPNAGIITGHTSFCLGSSITLSESVSGGSWVSSPATVASFISGSILTSVTPGIANIYYTVSNSCGSADAVYVDTVVELSAGAIYGPPGVCMGTPASYIDTAYLGTAIWEVSNSHATISSSGLLTPVSPGWDTVILLVSNACGVEATHLPVDINNMPVVTSISAPAVTCAGDSIPVADATPGGIWSTNDSMIVVVNSPLGEITGIAGGTAIIYYTIANACGAAKDSATLMVQKPIVVGPITGFTNVCIGGTTNMYDTSSGGTWSTVDTLIASISSSGVVTGLNYGAALISYTMVNACGYYASTSLVNVNNIGGVDPITGASNVCIGDNDTLADGTTGGTWASSATGVATVSSTGLVTTLSPGNTIITYTDSTICGLVAASYTVTVDTLPVAGAIFGASTVSMGGLDTLYDMTGGGTWSSSNSAVAVVNASTGVVTGIDTGEVIITYSITTTSGCSAIALFQLVVTPVSAVPVVISPDAHIFIYPNPVNDHLAISWDGENRGNAAVAITDMTGSEVFRTIIDMTAASGSAMVSLPGIANGVYFIRITVGTECFTGKIVVDRD